MSFMQPYVEHAQFYSVETSAGTWIVPLDVCGAVSDPRDLQPYCEGAIDFDEDVPAAEQVPELETGWLARMSAPGYMDCTDWSAYDSEQEAWEGLIRDYGDDEPGSVTYRWLPADWASYIVNGDASGLSDSEQDECDEYMAGEPELDWMSANVIGEASLQDLSDNGQRMRDCCMFLLTIKA